MIEILVGLSGSGKSTYAAEQAKNGALIVSSDSIIEGIGPYDKNLWPLYGAIEQAIITFGLSRGKKVIIDRANLTKKARGRYPKGTIIIFPFHETEVHARRRFHHDNRGLSLEEWIEIIDQQRIKFEPVTEDEGIILRKE